MRLRFACLLLLIGLCPTGVDAQNPGSATTGEKVRAVIAEAVIKVDAGEEQAKLVRSLLGGESALATELLKLWKEGGIFIYTAPDSKRVAVTLGENADGDGKTQAFRLSNSLPLTGDDGKSIRVASTEVESADTDPNLRLAIKDVMDAAALSAPDPKLRRRVASDMGLEQNVDKLPALEARARIETNSAVKRALREAIALTQLSIDDSTMRIQASAELGRLGSIPSQDALKNLKAEAAKAGQTDVAAAAQGALDQIAGHVRMVNTIGTLFRGLSAGSILLVVAIGLAITFGLMGVINMAHGELIVVGAYTTYVVQGFFATGVILQIPTFVGSPYTLRLPGMQLSGAALDSYFVLALPCSFLMAALVGIALERSIIRFLYKRPLESLLATWGVSLVLQQLFRLTFGANNVQVGSPAWLSGNWTVNDIQFGWNRVFVIGFAVLIIILTRLVLNKTPLGLLIRSVMQNREMAACMGVRTQRVNMLTFGFGSGLAGLAGAFLSQIGNVGPNLGQSYIVDCFMTVVVGGVGNLLGTVTSALSIGVIDQGLQQVLGNPVLGKILVLVGIILFLQWRPAGIFVTKSRSLES